MKTLMGLNNLQFWVLIRFKQFGINDPCLILNMLHLQSKDIIKSYLISLKFQICGH